MSSTRAQTGISANDAVNTSAKKRHARRVSQDDLEREHSLVRRLLVRPKLDDVLFGHLPVVVHIQPLPAEKLVDGNLEKVAEFEHDRGVREAFAVLPLGDCAVCNAKPLRKPCLREAPLFPARRDEPSDLFLIHGEHLLSMDNIGPIGLDFHEPPVKFRLVASISTSS
jgi:hypothetical protein